MQDARLTTQRTGSAGVELGRSVVRLALTAAVALTAITADGKEALRSQPRATAATPAKTPAALNSEITVRLYPTAVVTGEQVVLSDVAEVQGESAELVQRWPVTMAPHAGATAVIESSVIQSMLARRGINLGHWVFRGATRCVVSRPGEAKATNSRKPETVLSTRSALGVGRGDTTDKTSAPTTSPSNESHVCDANTLEALIREHVTQRLTSLDGTAIVRFSPAAAKVLALSRPTFDFQITDRSERLLGMVSLEVTILENGRPRQTVPVLADVSLRKSIVVAIRPINRGEIIDAASLDREERVFERAEDVSAGEMAGLVGQRAKRFIEAHGAVTARDIEPVPFVVRNDLVTVLVHRGTLTIRGSAKAMSSGSFGQTVTLKNEGSKETFSAVVTGPKQAEVGGAKGGSTQVAAAR